MSIEVYLDVCQKWLIYVWTICFICLSLAALIWAIGGMIEGIFKARAEKHKDDKPDKDE